MGRDQVIEKFRSFVAEEQDTLGRLLFWAERTVIHQTLAALDQAGTTKISFAELQVMQQLCLRDMRLTALAARMRMTKQAALQPVSSLERKGLIERRPDPDDGRAKVIGYTPAGLRLVEAAIDATMAVEREIAAAIGRAPLRALKQSLKKLIEADTAD